MRIANGDLGRAVYELICSHDGIMAREIARELSADKTDVNRCLYRYPFIADLCYHDEDFRWHGLIRQSFPHEGLADYSGWYGYVYEFEKLDEESWLEELREGCKRIGRNLNDTRGLIHSFTDTHATMRALFADLAEFGVDCGSWELVFELRIRRAKWVRIYADVLVVTPNCAFALEFKMKSAIDPDEVDQAAKYIPYLEVVLGHETEVSPALVLTRADGLYEHTTSSEGEEVTAASGDMLFNVFDEKLHFLA